MKENAKEPILCDDYLITKDQLPAQASAFIADYFAKAEIARVTLDKEIFDRSYEVTMSCGAKLEFNRDGEWDNIECPKAQIPVAILPKAIRDYLAAYYPGFHIKELERNRRSYEVKLESGRKLKFDADGEFIKIED